MRIVLSPRRVALGLGMVVLLLSFISLAAQAAMYLWGREGLLAFLTAFNVGEDQNVPTWYSSFALLLCSILTATITIAKRRRGDRFTIHWGVLSIVFLLLSVDEVATMHEDFDGSVLGLETGGVLYFSWVIPGVIMVLIGGLAYMKFLFSLPKEVRRLFIIGALLFVTGALGLEMLSARLISPYGMENWDAIPEATKIIIAVQTAIEELLEMLGVVVFVYGLLLYIGSYAKEVTLEVRDNK